jgi:hypothetical protein
MNQTTLRGWQFLYLSLTLIISQIAEAQPVISSGSASGITGFRARWRGLNNVNGGSSAFYLGNSNIASGGTNRVERTGRIYLQPGDNAVSFSYEPINDRLVGVINNDTIRYLNVSTRLVSPAQVCRLNFMNILLRNNTDGGAGILFHQVTLDGQSIGPFQLVPGGSIVTWNIQNKDFSTGFTIRGTMTLYSGAYGGSESSKLEITVGETEAVKSTSISSLCAGDMATVRFTGLLPNKSYTVNYTRNGVGAMSPSFSTDANGNGQFSFGPILSADINTNFIAQTFSVAGGCAWTSTTNNSSLITENSNCAILPVRWGHIGLKAIADQVQINWETTFEQHTQRFQVERSANAQNWQSVANIPAAGFSQSLRKYQWIDPSPLTGTSYYRIRQIDTDQRFSISKTLRFQWANLQEMRIGPNPVQHELILTMPPDPNLMQLQIRHMGGQVLKQWESPSGTIRYDASLLAPGKYWVQLRYKNGQVETKSFLKQ